MERFVKVDLPVNRPEKTLKLCKKIVAKHTALGAGSPVTGFVDMLIFGSKYNNAQGFQDDGDTRQEDSEALHNQAEKACGIMKGQGKQSEGTLYWFVLQIRDVLLAKSRNQEQDLETWGFNVVVSYTGARKNVRIDIPKTNPLSMVELAEDIMEKHLALALTSPLLAATELDLVAFATKVAAARGLVDAWELARADMQALHGQALNLIGYSAGQNSNIEGTLYFDLITLRTRLLQVNQGVEQELERWGFTVVIHDHSTGPKNDDGTEVPEPVTKEGDLNTLVATNVNTDNLSALFTMILLVAAGSTMRFYLSTAPGVLPLPGDAFIDVLAGVPVSKTIAELMTLLGASDSKKYLNVQNMGATPGHYSVTFS